MPCVTLQIDQDIDFIGVDAPRAVGGVALGDIGKTIAVFLDGAAKGAAVIRSTGIGIYADAPPVMRREQPADAFDSAR